MLPDPDGDFVVVWTRFESDGFTTTDWRIQIRTLSASGVLGPVETLSETSHPAFAPSMALTPNGSAVVVWQELNGATWRIKARIQTASESLSLIQTLSPAGQDAFDPHVAVDTNGNPVAVWRWFDGWNYRVQLVRISLE